MLPNTHGDDSDSDYEGDSDDDSTYNSPAHISSLISALNVSL